jgi:ubiquinone/menaquinone biosynthesis C-methylase UbiE
MSKIEWQTKSSFVVGKHTIPCAPILPEGFHQGNGIKTNTQSKRIIKQLIWPFFKCYCDFFVDGFIEREVGKLIKRYMGKDTTFLEVGCGDMSLLQYLPADVWYNALDLQISDFHILRSLRTKKRVNLVVASATNIPVLSDIASIIVSTETFEHIPDIDKAVQEIQRVGKSDAILICSIPNNFCHKYIKKGAHAGHINNWTYMGFIEYMKARQFEFVEGFMKGVWIPFPLWVTKTSYQVPVSIRNEYFSTNFFYVFRIKK